MSQGGKKYVKSRSVFFAWCFFGSCGLIFPGVTLASTLTPSAVITLANKARVEAGLAPLQENALLTEAAEAKAEDMVTHGYFSHVSPSGVEPWHWFKEAHYSYEAAGENLAINYTDAKEENEAWMQSATHRANILGARYQDIGVAVRQGRIGGKEALLTVEFFGVRGEAVVKNAPLVSEIPRAQVEQVVIPNQSSKQAEILVSSPSFQMSRFFSFSESEEYPILFFFSRGCLFLALLAPPLLFVGLTYRSFFVPRVIVEQHLV